MIACAFPYTADTSAGGKGATFGTIKPEADEYGPLPSELEARTINLYSLPFERPDTTQLVVELSQNCPVGTEKSESASTR